MRDVRVPFSSNPKALDTMVGISFQFKEATVTRRHRLREVMERVKARERHPQFDRRVTRGHAHPLAGRPHACRSYLKPKALDTTVDVSFQYKEAGTWRRFLREVVGGVNRRMKGVPPPKGR